MPPACWVIDRPEEKVNIEDLASVGVFYMKLDHTQYEDATNQPLEELCKERGYTYRDFVDSSKIPNLEEKLDHFKTEHLHDDDEIRFFIGGSGYFDVKNTQDEYVRIHCFPGDLVSLPAGIYHRFVPDATMSFYVMRLFKGDPVWTPHNRATEANDKRAARQAYMREYYPTLTTPEVYMLDDKTQTVSMDKLAKLGVYYQKLDPRKYEKDSKLDAICKERGYTYRDFVDSSKIRNLEEKLDHFKIEHLHDDDEIRYFVRGSGYFDVKDDEDEWVRIHCTAGDFVTLPAGIYHRFIPDEKLSFYVMRLFAGDPVWTPWNRQESSTSQRDARKAYVAKTLEPSQKKQKTSE